MHDPIGHSPLASVQGAETSVKSLGKGQEKTCSLLFPPV